MLDIANMSEEDKLFNFMSGLQPWAQAELRRQGIKVVQTAMAAADNLVNFKYNNPCPSTTFKKIPDGKGKGKETSPRRWKKFDGGKKDGGFKQSSTYVPKTGYYICQGPHVAYVFPCDNWYQIEL